MGRAPSSIPPIPPSVEPGGAQQEGLPISEIFASVQGEGSASGRPSSFIRFAGCNLACTWCDTAYASWDLKPFETLGVQAVLAKVRDQGHSWVVVTGGEPTFFGPKFLALSHALKEAGFKLQLETNATIWLDEIPALYDHVTLSPKLEGSGEGASFNLPVLRRYLDSSLRGGKRPFVELKLVIADEKDLLDAARKLEALDPPPGLVLILQPNGLGQDPVALGRRLAEDAGQRKGVFEKAFSKYEVRVLGQWQRLYWQGVRAR